MTTGIDLEGLTGAGILPQWCAVVTNEIGSLELTLAHTHSCYVTALRFSKEERTLYVDMVYADDDLFWNCAPYLLPVSLPEGVMAVRAGVLEKVEKLPDPVPYYTEGLPRLTYE